MTVFKSIIFAGLGALITLALFGPVCSPVALPKPKLTPVHQKDKVPEKLHLTVYIDDKFTPQERFSVTLGIREWERATNGMITIQTESGWTMEDDFRDVPDRINVAMGRCSRSVHVARIVSENPLIQKIEEEVGTQIDGFANGTCEAKYVLIVIDRNDDLDQVQQTMTHELGHLLGLEHIKVPYRTAMYPGDMKCTMCLTELDLAQLCDLPQYECDVSKLQPCVPTKK